MIAISVKSDLDKLTAVLSVLEEEQLPFTTAVALTRTAWDAQKEIVAQMPSRFTLRRDWITKGVVVKGATKQDLKAIVYDRDKFMVKQETGGVQVNLNGKKYLAVPMPDTKRTGGGIVSQADLLKNLGTFQRQGNPKSGNIILIPSRSVPGAFYVAVREANAMKGGRRGSTFAQTGLRLVWELRPETHYTDKFEFGPTVAKVVADRFAVNFGDALAEAMATARSR